MKEHVTPIRSQYLDIKRAYPGCLVLFRLGDFYETFDDDAVLTAKELNIVLTSRSMGKGMDIPMAGIPFHALDEYLSRLIKGGHKVAICEQISRPGANKGLVQRDVVRVVTPGTVVEPKLLDTGTNNFLAAIITEGNLAGLAYVDITTGEFATTQMPLERLPAEIERLRPSEILGVSGQLPGEDGSYITYTSLAPELFRPDITETALREYFDVSTLEGFGCAHLPLAVRAAGAILGYLETTQKSRIGHLRGLSTYRTDHFMAIDPYAQINLELFQIVSSDSKGSTLFSTLNLTQTPMGSRLLRRRLGQPILETAEINSRLDAVEYLARNDRVRTELISLLGQISDSERLAVRVKNRTVIPRELVALKRNLRKIPEICELLAGVAPLAQVVPSPQPDTVSIIDSVIVDQPENGSADGGFIKEGYSAQLDALKKTSRKSRQFLADLEKDQRESTGIKNLKVGYNNIFGYYIEIPHSNKEAVPPNYIRKQTLSNCERYFTPEIKEFETQILNARERIEEMESTLFRQVCDQIEPGLESVLAAAARLAELDVFAALAECAERYDYCRPLINENSGIDIRKGRHPVVERALPPGLFVPNDTSMNPAGPQIIILTGPNMAGKSTYLKQVALIVLMAHLGSFVPAERADIGIVDRIFTRIGAREDMASGHSTFMVEMIETANILNNATPRSLLIMDEIGRGTSTQDGLAIATAVVEYLHNSPHAGAMTLFATHYHELVRMAENFPRVKNYNVAVSDNNGTVVLLHRILPGGTDKSYGIHVARLAGLPRPVTRRADEILAELESVKPENQPWRREAPAATPQLALWGQVPPFMKAIAELDIDQMSPLDALNRLYSIQQLIRQTTP